MSERIPLIGRLAVHHKLVTLAQMADVLRLQGSGDARPLGTILVEEGLISQGQLEKLLLAQKQLVEKHRAAGSAEPARPAEPPRIAEPARTAEPPRIAEPARTPEPPRIAELAKPPPRVARVTAAGDTSELDHVLRAACERGASDVHLHCGARIQQRIAGRIEPAADDVLDPTRSERMLIAALAADQRHEFEEKGELDVCYTLSGVGRFRANVYRQQRGVDGVFHCIPPEPPTLADLGLPTSLARFTQYHQGMVLVTGPAGCGKSTTLAALVNLINEERREHIITIEDPVEYLHPSKRCLVNQRSVKRHTESFARALRAALREDPDVIVIGELRDLETVSLALTAAETGHFVLATLHTDDAIRTVNRLVGAFPSDQQDQVRSMLSESLRAVVSQRLIPRADGQGRAPALEVLVVTRAVANLIRENKTFQIQSILQTGASQGMAMLDQSIRELLRSGVIAAEEARRYSAQPEKLGA